MHNRTYINYYKIRITLLNISTTSSISKLNVTSKKDKVGKITALHGKAPCTENKIMRVKPFPNARKFEYYKIERRNRRFLIIYTFIGSENKI